MEYPFKNLQPLDEATARTGYYRDWSHIDADTFHQISELATFIREKGHGADTREAMAQALERVYHDAAQSGNANMEVSMARGGFHTLGERLNDTNTQLAQTKQAFNDSVSKVTTDSEVILARGGKTTLGTRIDDIESGDGIDSGAITPRKTNFFYISKNLFDKTNVILGKGINTSTGVVEDNANNFIAELDLEPGTYTVNNFNRGGVRIAQYNASGDLHVMGVYLSGDSFNVAGKDAVTKIIISSSQGNLGDDLMINEGEIALHYEPYDNVYIPTKHIEPLKNTDIADGLITPNKTNFFHISKNLFDKENVLDGKAIDPSTGNIIDRETNFVYELEVNGGETFSISGFGNIRVVGYHFDGWVNMGNLYTDDATFIVNENTRLLRLTSDKANLNSLMLNRGNVVLPYEEYGNHTILPQFLPESSKTETNNDVYFAPLAVDKSYIYSSDSTNVEALDGTGVSGLRHQDVTVSLIYEMYDELMSEFPDNITREQLGMDESDTYPIYKYRFKPNPVLNTPRSKIHKDIPVLTLITGTHGPGAQAGDLVNNILILHWFMKDVYMNWKQNEIFDWFRQNAIIDVIPTLNPWGVDNHDRKNSRGVDINRNFDASGWYSGEPTSTQYGGVEPFSEAESQALLNYVNSTDNISLLMDFHTVGGSSDPSKFIYFSADISNGLLPVSEYHVKRLSSKWKQHRTYLDQTVENYGYIHNAGSGGMISKWADEQGIPSIILETAPDMPNSGQSRNNQVIMELGYENLANWLFHVVHHLSKH